MEFFCRAIMTVLFVTFNPILCADLDQDVKGTLVIGQLALAEQSSALAQQCQALSQLLETRQQNQPHCQGESQALVQMAQDFQEAMTRLTKELSTQQSSSLITLSQEQCREHSSSLNKISQDVNNVLRNSEELRNNLTYVSHGLQEAIANLSLHLSSSLSQISSEMKSQFRAFQNQLLEAINENMTKMAQELQESKTLIQELSQRETRVPSGFEMIDGGWFRLIQIQKSWVEAREYCKDLGSDLASPPTDLDAFRAFITKEIGVTDDVWLDGRLVSPGNWRHLNGLPIDASNWNSGQPEANHDCLITDGDMNPLYWGASCTATYFFVCRWYS